jgi:hypothetical protein
MEQYNKQLAVKVDQCIEALAHNLKEAESSGLPTINTSPSIDHPADHRHEFGWLVHLACGVSAL